MVTNGMKVYLVYQAGLANVFQVDQFNNNKSGKSVRLLQGTFDQCYWFALGMKQAGSRVLTAFCNKAGDISRIPWDTSYEDAPFNRNIHVIE